MTGKTGDMSVHPKVSELSGLTSLRFLAAMFVILYHYIGKSYPVYGNVLFGLGYTGVTFFFLLSGFILAYNYERVDFGQKGRFARFLTARFARIYPLYLLTLLFSLGPFIAALAKGMEPLLHRLYLSDLILAPLALQSWVPGAATAINFPSWSISTECFFYACFPLLLRRILASPGKWLVFTVVYWLLVNLLSYSLWHSFGPKDLLISFPASDTPTILLEEFIKYCPLIRLPEFMAGILTYVCWSRYRKHLKPVLMLVISFISLVMLVAFSDRLPATLIHNGLSMVVWLPLVLYGAGASSPILTSSFSVFLGRLSFGLYLFHAPCLLYVKAAAKRMPGLLTPDTVLWTALLLSFLLATVCHLCIEETMRRRIYKTISPNLPADR